MQHAITPVPIQMQQNGVPYASLQAPHGRPPPRRQAGVPLASRHQTFICQVVNATMTVNKVYAALEKGLIGLVAHGGQRNVQIHVGQQVGGLMEGNKH